MSNMSRLYLNLYISSRKITHNELNTGKPTPPLKNQFSPSNFLVRKLEQIEANILITGNS